MNTTDFSPVLLDHCYVILVTLVLPLISRSNYRRIRPLLLANKSLRVYLYTQSMIALWIVLLLTLALWVINERPFALMGITANGIGSLPFTILLLVALGFAVSIPARISRVGRDDRLCLRIARRLELTPGSELIPTDEKELKLFLPLSLSAGICEEVLFRGYILWYCSEHFSVILAVLISSLLFGFAHSYQGKKGVLLTSLIGIGLAMVVLTTKSLWLAILFHALVDIHSGSIGYATRRCRQIGDIMPALNALTEDHDDDRL